MAISSAPAKTSGRPAAGKFSGRYEVVGDVELSSEEDAAAREQIRQADSERADVSVTFRWGQQQLAIVRRAAKVAGIPYQTYLKDAVMRRAIDDLRAAQAAGVPT
jgi:predicted DNA binding CopG/RHH family protein